MGIWRIPVDETSGHATGPSEPVASGVDVAMDLPHLSRDGQSLLFRSRIEAVNPAAIAFDPVAGRAGEVRLLQHRTSILVPTDVSPDGRWLALYSAVSRQQDIFIMQSDGGGLTHLTDDSARDWFPRFTADGEALVFHSNLGGSYEAWSIRLDGSGRTLLTNLSAPAVSPVLSADGQRLVVGTLPARDRHSFKKIGRCI